MKLHTYLIAAGLAAASMCQAADYHVGPAFGMKKLSQVPWTTLKPGDTVYVHPTPGGYHETFQLMNSGTPDKPISVIGVRDPLTGKRPVLDGSNSLLGPSVTQGYYSSLYMYGGIIISPPRNFRWGDAPSYLIIDGLEICNFKQTSTFTTQAGARRNFDRFACGIYCERVRHLIVRNCSIHDNGNGFFCNSKYQAAGLSQDLLVEHNLFLKNGNPGSFSEHHIYTEAEGVLIQNNRFGPLVDTSHGAAIKDRSAGTVVRYNTMVVSQYGIAVYFVSPQGGSDYIERLPSYQQTYFYGNVIYNPPTGGEAFVLFGEGTNYAKCHRGTLYAYNNTFVNKADLIGAKRRIGAFAFRLPTMIETGGLPITETVDCRNNVFYCVSETKGLPATNLALLYVGGAAHFDLGVNWLSPSVTGVSIARGGPFPPPIFTGYWDLIIDKNNNPGFFDNSGQMGVTNAAKFLASVDPALIVGLIDPNELVHSMDPNRLFQAVDIERLKQIVDPKYFVNGIDPAYLVGVIDPNDLVGVIDPNEFVALIDANFLIGLLDEAMVMGTLDPWMRPTTSSSLTGAGGALSPALPSWLVPAVEPYGLGLRQRPAKLSLGAFEPIRF